jgi:hypothetical protein
VAGGFNGGRNQLKFNIWKLGGARAGDANHFGREVESEDASARCRQDACAPSTTIAVTRRVEMLGQVSGERPGAAANFQNLMTICRQMPQQVVMIVIVVGRPILRSFG